MTIDLTRLYRRDTPEPAERWDGFPAYNMVGGHNDADSVPADALADAAARVLRREGSTLATYGLDGGGLGHRGLRRFVAAALGERAGIDCGPDQVLVTSGSLQALDLVNALFLDPGDTVIVEGSTYGGALSRLNRLGVTAVGVDLDEGGMRVEHLSAVLEDLTRAGIAPKFIYTIPTVQNPTGTVLSADRRRDILSLAHHYQVPIFEDDCYADLVWTGARPPAMRGMDDTGSVIYCGSFSKSIAPALRVGYMVADWPVLSRLQALKTDGGTGAVEQMIIADFAPDHFDAHVSALRATLRVKCEVMATAVRDHFGDTARFHFPEGGIFMWLTLPGQVDTTDLADQARAAGIEFNPGAEWCADPEEGRNRLRLCFAHPSPDAIRAGVAGLADICRRLYGVPTRDIHTGPVDAAPGERTTTGS